MGSKFDLQQYLLSLLGLQEIDICQKLVHNVDNYYDIQTNSMYQVQSIQFIQGYVMRFVEKILYDNGGSFLALTESYLYGNDNDDYDTVTFYDYSGILIENNANDYDDYDDYDY
jgi:hypothetical protein